MCDRVSPRGGVNPWYRAGGQTRAFTDETLAGPIRFLVVSRSTYGNLSRSARLFVPTYSTATAVLLLGLVDTLSRPPGARLPTPAAG